MAPLNIYNQATEGRKNIMLNSEGHRSMADQTIGEHFTVDIDLSSGVGDLKKMLKERVNLDPEKMKLSMMVPMDEEAALSTYHIPPSAIINVSFDHGPHVGVLVKRLGVTETPLRVAVKPSNPNCSQEELWSEIKGGIEKAFQDERGVSLPLAKQTLIPIKNAVKDETYEFEMTLEMIVLCKE